MWAALAGMSVPVSRPTSRSSRLDQPPRFSGNLANVSLEDVLAARPDIIIASDPAFSAALPTLASWRDVPAMRNGRIYVPPDLPFG